MKDFFKLLPRLRKYKGLLLLSIFSNILLSIFTVVSIPLIIPFFQLLFDQTPDTSDEKASFFTSYFASLIETSGREKALFLVCLAIVAVFFLKNLFRYLAIYFLVPVRNGIVKDYRSELFAAYSFLPYQEIKNTKIGDLISRITADVQEIEWSVLKVIETVFKAPLIILGSIVFMLYVSPKLSLFVLVLLFFTAFIIGGISKSLKKKSTIAQEKIGNISSIVEESLSGNKVVKAFGAEQKQIELFEKENVGYRDTMIRLARRQDLSSPLSEFLGVSVVTFLLYYGSHLVFKESLEPATFFAFIFAFYQVIEPAKSFSTAFYSIQKGAAAMNRVDEFLALPKEVIEDDGKNTTFTDRLEVKSLSYQFQDSTKPVIENLSFEVLKGQSVAIVGPSGSGKTTLADVLLGLYPIEKGEVQIDGKSIANMTLSEQRKYFSLVSQKPILFNDTIENNILFGKSNVQPTQVEQAIAIANAKDFIESFPEGLQTKVGDKGVRLSGGQRQRITIARAVLSDAPILILDEATSNLDSESEQLVQQSLNELLKGRTAIVIAHRLSTIKRADVILVMDGGKIIARGNHEELLQQSELYQKYVSMQMLR